MFFLSPLQIFQVEILWRTGQDGVKGENAGPPPSATGIDRAGSCPGESGEAVNGLASPQKKRKFEADLRFAWCYLCREMEMKMAGEEKEKKTCNNVSVWFLNPLFRREVLTRDSRVRCVRVWSNTLVNRILKEVYFLVEPPMYSIRGYIMR